MIRVLGEGLGKDQFYMTELRSYPSKLEPRIEELSTESYVSQIKEFWATVS